MFVIIVVAACRCRCWGTTNYSSILMHGGKIGSREPNPGPKCSKPKALTTAFFCFFFFFLPVFVYYILIFSIINDESGCEVVQAKVPICDGTT